MNPPTSTSRIWEGTNSAFGRGVLPENGRDYIVIGRQYLARQATTLLRFANSTSNPELAAALVEKAAKLKLQVDEATSMQDQSLRAPDVEQSS
jgi:hypothetical protein